MEGNFPRNKLNKRNILNALFDVRPVKKSGDLDLSRIRKIGQILDLSEIVKKKKEEEINLNQNLLRIKAKPIVRKIKLSVKPKSKKKISRPKKIYKKKRERIEEQILTREEIPTEEKIPTREEILNELELIERENQELEKFRIHSGIAKATEEIITKEMPESNFPEEEIPEEILPEEKVEEPLTENLKEEPAEEPFREELTEDFFSKENLTEENQIEEELPEEEKPAIEISPFDDQFYFKEVAEKKDIIAGPFGKPLLKKKKTSLKSLGVFLATGFLVISFIPLASWVNKGLNVKDQILKNGASAYGNLLDAKESLEKANWQEAGLSFNLAGLDFQEARQEIQSLGKVTLGILENFPFSSSVSSGEHLVKVGESLSQAGEDLTAAIGYFASDDMFSFTGKLTQNISLANNKLNNALAQIKIAEQEIREVKADDFEGNIQEAIIFLQEKLPQAEDLINQSINYSTAFLKILGHDNPRQYLLLFQNNSEMRATGGFIGTYGLLTLDRGEINDLFIDGIFNADGQLHDKIIPPQPIQKISTAWSMHDANWFADFPTSAEKIAWFYEKTGGPTVDGIITLTPVVVEKLIKLTGPVPMPEYEMTLDADNFVELIQQEVEVDYDKELNQPKKILADFAPKFIQILKDLPLDNKKEALEIIFQSLEEKQILLYFDNDSLEDLIKEEGWGGELISTEKDYLSVVSSNINGYKTDRVIKETISHQAEIQEDGSVIDTLVIKRKHLGGQMQYEWWNKVNSNYLRVYLPKGSQLISANGQTKETYQPPINYQESGFTEDPLVSSILADKQIDEKTGTEIFEENGKTVFGNWVYVSPQKEVTLTYQYKLPFKIDLTKIGDSYSLLVQKQAGSLGSSFSHQLDFPENWHVSWKYPEESQEQSGNYYLETDLTQDRFLGLTFEF